MSTITPDAPVATPAIVTVHYRHPGADEELTFTGALAARQYDGCIGIVPNERAWADPHVCRWQMSWDRITRIEILRPAWEPTTADLIAAELAALALTGWERNVLDALADIGGPVQWRDVPDIVRYVAGHEHLEERQVRDVLASLKAKGYVTLTNSAGLASGVVTLT